MHAWTQVYSDPTLILPLLELSTGDSTTFGYSSETCMGKKDLSHTHNPTPLVVQEHCEFFPSLDFLSGRRNILKC